MHRDSADNADLAARIAASADLEAAGSILLGAVLAQVAEHLAAAPAPPADVGLLRAALHVRGSDGYRALVLVAGPGSDGDTAEAGGLAASTTAWEQVRRRDEALAVDVHLGEVRSLGSVGTAAHRLPGRAQLSTESQELFLGRGATHVFALPARAGGMVQGMVTVELSCLAAMGTDLPALATAAGPVQALLDACFPEVLGRGAAATGPSEERDLPVVGRAMGGVVRMLRRVAAFDDTVLLMGETGVGKSQLARWIHTRSRRHRQPFEAVHLQNYPQTLVEGELFGWRKGAHDGARADKQGHVARAEGGTLFLDEIDKIPLAVQRKLLLLLESREWRPLGDSGRYRTADVRFVVGTNADLDALVAEGAFLPDLLWRIRTVPVRVPSLAERKDELRGWAEFFLRRKHLHETGQGDATLSDRAAELLAQRSWPGNLRQLDQVMVRAWLVAADVDQDGPLHVDSTSLRAALAFDAGRGAPPPLDEALRQAAAAFRLELERRQQEGLRPLSLEDADAFRGYVLTELEEHLGLDEAFRSLGLEKRVEGRNHHATFKREVDRVRRLWEEEE